MAEDNKKNSAPDGSIFDEKAVDRKEVKGSVKIAFSDFWDGFDYNPSGKESFDNTLYSIVSERYKVEISENPDFLIYSVFGDTHKKYNNCKKIFYTGENRRPDFNQCDYSISFDYINDPRNHRFPLSGLILYENKIFEQFEKKIETEKIKNQKTKFCNFVFSNPNAPLRNQLFMKLSRYKRVDSGGIVFNNLGHTVGDKLNFISDYKFTIAFENSESPGYTTEKLVHPKLVDSIPIYWGNPEFGKDWNTKSVVNAYDYKNINDLVDYIIEMDNDDDLYFKTLNEPHFNKKEIPRDLDYRNLLDFLDRIFSNNI